MLSVFCNLAFLLDKYAVMESGEASGLDVVLDAASGVTSGDVGAALFLVTPSPAPSLVEGETGAGVADGVVVVRGVAGDAAAVSFLT